MLRSWVYSVLGLFGFLVGAYLLLTYGLPLLLPFAVALFAAELIEPIVGVLSMRGRLPRSLAVALVLLVFLALMATAVTAAIGRLVHELEDMTARLPYLYAVGLDLADRFADHFGALNAALPSQIQGMLADNLSAVQSSLMKQLPNLAGTLSAVSSVPAFLTNLLIAVIATFFMSRDRRTIGGFLLSLFPVDWRPKIRRVKDEVWTSSMGFAKAQGMLITLTMIQSIIGLSLIGANYAVLIGILIGIADLMPVLGPASVYIPWILYGFIFGGSVGKVFALKLLILYAIIVGVRQVLEAKLVGDQIGLHPLAILLSIYLGFQFFGALGFVAGPILAILLKAMIQSGLLPIFQEDPK